MRGNGGGSRGEERRRKGIEGRRILVKLFLEEVVDGMVEGKSIGLPACYLMLVEKPHHKGQYSRQ